MSSRGHEPPKPDPELEHWPTGPPPSKREEFWVTTGLLFGIPSVLVVAAILSKVFV